MDAVNSVTLPGGMSLPKTIPKGKPGSGKSVKYQMWFDNTKSRKVLGMTYRPMEETARDIIVDFKRRGIVQ